MGHAEEAHHKLRMADLQPGWAVVGNDGKQVGAVQRVGQNYVLTSTDGLASDIYIPASAIANVEHDVIHLSMPQRDVAQMGWEQPPRDDDVPTTSESDLHRHV